jgi:hypothetical protein
MHLTGTSKGIFKKSIVLSRDGVEQAVLRMNSFNGTLQMADGAVHEYTITPAEGRMSLTWRAAGAEVVTLDLLTKSSFTDGLRYQGVVYGIAKREGKVFDVLVDGRAGGTFTRTGGFFSSDFILETNRDMPVEAVAFLVFLIFAYPVLRFL